MLTIAGEGKLRRVPLPDRGAVVLGRDAGCDVVPDDTVVSKKHARLTTEEAGAVLTDLGSKNGTRIAGAKISAPHPLATGSVFEVGGVTLVLNRVSGRLQDLEDGPVAPVVLDPAMKALFELVEQIAPSDLSVLLLGETGSGKEVVASMLHARSNRHAAALVKLNCAALPMSLLEAELFGHEQGAFTGAIAKNRGLIEQAHGGTLFLDEVGELPIEAQAKVLRAIEDGAFYRVGGRQSVRVDVRFVAATNRDLAIAVSEGRFRADLFYRLNGIAMRIPPLRDRREEILPLAKHFMLEAARAAGLGGAPTLAPDAEAALLAHGWPGNVRELKNTMHRAVLLSRGAVIGKAHLLLDPAIAVASAADLGARATLAPPAPPIDSSGRLAPPSSHPRGSAKGGDLRTELSDLERQRIVEALEACGGNQTRAAVMLGISRRTLISRLEIFGIPRPLKG